MWEDQRECYKCGVAQFAHMWNEKVSCSVLQLSYQLLFAFQHYIITKICQTFIYESQMFSIVGLNLTLLGCLIVLCIQVGHTRIFLKPVNNIKSKTVLLVMFIC